jgi:hypothetical protein
MQHVTVSPVPWPLCVGFCDERKKNIEAAVGEGGGGIDDL